MPNVYFATVYSNALNYSVKTLWSTLKKSFQHPVISDSIKGMTENKTDFDQMANTNKIAAFFDVVQNYLVLGVLSSCAQVTNGQLFPRC